MRSQIVTDFRSTQHANQKRALSILFKENFAAQMVELEILIEIGDFNIENLQKLMDFYSQAVDHYVQVQSNNYIFFKNKIKSLLLKPRVVELINAQEAKNRHEKQNEEFIRISTESKLTDGKMHVQNDFKQPDPISSRLNHEFHYKMENFHLNRDLSTIHQKRQIEGLVKNYANHHEVKEGVIKSSLMDQKNVLRKKIEERRAVSRIRNSDNSLLSVDKLKRTNYKRLADVSIRDQKEFYTGNNLEIIQPVYKEDLIS
jgi:hypothetical protein